MSYTQFCFKSLSHFLLYFSEVQGACHLADRITFRLFDPLHPDPLTPKLTKNYWNLAFVRHQSREVLQSSLRFSLRVYYSILIEDKGKIVQFFLFVNRFFFWVLMSFIVINKKKLELFFIWVGKFYYDRINNLTIVNLLFKVLKAI